jgi:hypothetical protein
VEPVLDPDEAPEVKTHHAVQIVVRPPIDEEPADALTWLRSLLKLP